MITAYDLEMIALHTGDVAGKLDGKRILMTGGTGFVGRWMRLIGRGNITALSRLDYEHGDWERERWDYIVHLANVAPSRVIACARRSGAPILYASSGATTDREPQEYATGKLMAEQELLESGLPVHIARMYTFAGAFMPNRFAVINYITDAITTRVIKIRGPNVTRTYLYAADMAAWMWRVLLKGKPGTTYAVGSEYPVTMWELAREVQLHFDHPLITENLIYHGDARPYYVPDTYKTRQECGVDVWTPFDQAIARTVAHYVEEEKTHVP